MRRLLAACAILLLILSCSLALGRAVEQDVTEVILPLSQAQAAAEGGDWNTARSLVSLAEERWNAHRFPFRALLPHSDLDEIAISFLSVRTYASARVFPDYAAASAILTAQLLQLAEQERPAPENIF